MEKENNSDKSMAEELQNNNQNKENNIVGSVNILKDEKACLNSPEIASNTPSETDLNQENHKNSQQTTKRRKYRKKENLKRFYTPKEWFSLLKQIKNEKHKFFIEFLLHTGARINEARGVRIKDIDFEKEQIVLRQTKGGTKKNRTIQISTYLVGRIKSYIASQKIESKLNTLGFPSTVMMDKMIKRYTMLAGIDDWKDFSCHNLRKTLENWACAINVNILTIQAHMGHTVDVASAHYVATQLMNAEDKSLIRAILDNLWNK